MNEWTVSAESVLPRAPTRSCRGTAHRCQPDRRVESGDTWNFMGRAYHFFARLSHTHADSRSAPSRIVERG